MQNVAGKFLVPITKLTNQTQFRIIPSLYPPINFFEDLVDANEMETVWWIESLTNERLRQETGDIFLVAPEDRVSGPGSSVVMAAFTHIGNPSRFTDGSYGVYYAALTLETAIKETVYQRELFLAATAELACELTMRVYEGKVLHPLHDIRAKTYTKLHAKEGYLDSQAFAKQMRNEQSSGLVYPSARHKAGTCIAAFKPKAISLPKQTKHLRYIWNGEKITDVLDIQSLFHF